MSSIFSSFASWQIVVIAFGAFFLYLIFYDWKKAAAILNFFWLIIYGIFKVIFKLFVWIFGLFTGRK